METYMKEMFDAIVSDFMKESSIHDLCSKQVTSVIKKAEWIKPTDSIMDFGCSVGSLTFTLNHDIEFKECLGLDSSEEMLKVFDQLVKKAHLENKIKSTCIFLDSPDQLNGQKFDVIISLKAFHHIENPPECIDLLKTYLNPGGRLIICDLIHSPEYHRSVEEPCCHGFTVECMNNMLTKAGFRPDVRVSQNVHYMECLDQEEGKKAYEALPEYTGDIVEDDPATLPPYIKIQSTYYERDIFPFVVACGFL